MMLTKRNMMKMIMIVLEYSEYSSAGKASNAIWTAIYNYNVSGADVKDGKNENASPVFPSP